MNNIFKNDKYLKRLHDYSLTLDSMANEYIEETVKNKIDNKLSPCDNVYYIPKIFIESMALNDLNSKINDIICNCISEIIYECTEHGYIADNDLEEWEIEKYFTDLYDDTNMLNFELHIENAANTVLETLDKFKINK